MSDEANTLKEERKKVNRTTSSIHLRLSPKIIRTIDEVVKGTGKTRTDWIRDAVQRGLKNWKSPFDNPALWTNCRHCGRKHDPAVHGLDD